MTEKIDWFMGAQVVGGPKVSASGTLEVEAYDKIEIEVSKGTASTASSVTVDLQPSSADNVHFIFITASWYGDDLSFAPDATKPTETKTLDAPLMLIAAGDSGSTTLLSSTKKFMFYNRSTTKSAIVSILIGRKAKV